MYARTKANLSRPDYPDWDRRTNAMPDQHRGVLDATVSRLTAHFASDPTVYVSGNTPIFFTMKGRRTSVTPDVYVAKGAGSQKRGGYQTGDEEKGPDVVFELVSRPSVREDAERKFRLYQDYLTVEEYFLFDPLGESLEPALQGYRLSRGRYRPIGETSGQLYSRMLGLLLRQHGGELFFQTPSADW